MDKCKTFLGLLMMELYRMTTYHIIWIQYSLPEVNDLLSEICTLFAIYILAEIDVLSLDFWQGGDLWDKKYIGLFPKYNIYHNSLLLSEIVWNFESDTVLLQTGTQDKRAWEPLIHFDQRKKQHFKQLEKKNVSKLS